MTRRRAGALLGGAAMAVLVAGTWWGLARLDREEVEAFVRPLGPLAPLALFVLLVLQCVVAPVPSEPIMMAVGYLYGPRGGFALSWAGVVVGAAACFGLARLVGRPFAERVVRRERLDAADGWLRERGTLATFAGLLLIRLIAFSSFDILSYACGLLGVPFSVFLLATVLGAVPKVFAFTYVGAHAAAPGWMDGLILAGTFGVLLMIPWLARYRRAIRGA